MAWANLSLFVQQKFNFVGFGSNIAEVREWIAQVYSAPLGQSLIDSVSLQVTIQYQPGFTLRTNPTTHTITMDPSWLTTNGGPGFITKDGYFVSQSPPRLMYHELVHAMLGIDEGVWSNSQPDVWTELNSANVDLTGPTVPLENAFANQFETPVGGHSLERPSYFANGIKINCILGGDSWTAKYDGTVVTVDSVIIDNADWASRIDFSKFGNTAQLIIGARNSDRLIGGQGADFIYGDFDAASIQNQPGDDFLFGGDWSGSPLNDGAEIGAGYVGNIADGKKWIDGASDRLEGGAGFDTYFTGALKAGGGAFQTQLGETGRADLTYSINQAVYDQIDIISDSDGQGVIWAYSEQDGVAYSDGGPSDMNAYRFSAPAKIAPTTYRQVSAGYWLADGALNGLVYDQETGFYLYTSDIDYKNHDIGFLAYFAIKGFQWGALGFNQAAAPPPQQNAPPPPPPSTGPTTIQGGLLRDVLTGTTGADVINASGGNDTINGGNGDDVIIGGAGRDLIDGGAGNDTASYVDTTSALDIDLQLYPDQRGGTAHGDVLFSIESIAGSGFDDTIRGSADNNYLAGGGGADTLDGRTGSDILNGGAGADTLTGGLGNDTMIGGDDSDVYVVESAGDVVVEAVGGGINDFVYTTVSYTLAAGQEIEGFTASPLAGTNPVNLTGNEFRQVIRGNNGINTILGGGGNDSLYGYGGNDTLESQAGNDALFGGTGVDRFQFRQSLGAASGIDRIYDFTSSDYIKIDATAVTSLTALQGYEFVAGTAALDVSDRVIYEQATGSLWFDADGSGSAAKILFAILDTKPVISSADVLMF